MEKEEHGREMTATQVFENTNKSFIFSALNQFRNRQVESSTLSLGSKYSLLCCCLGLLRALQGSIHHGLRFSHDFV